MRKCLAWLTAQLSTLEGELQEPLTSVCLQLVIEEELCNSFLMFFFFFIFLTVAVVWKLIWDYKKERKKKKTRKESNSVEAGCTARTYAYMHNPPPFSLPFPVKAAILHIKGQRVFLVHSQITQEMNKLICSKWWKFKVFHLPKQFINVATHVC